ncbi:MAG: CHASE2 domain-containing protein [Blastochloris sp.]|nr:CHASE2 domain-containing protein [Blastochloris sp.]
MPWISTLLLRHRSQLVTAGLCAMSGLLWVILWVGALKADSGSLLLKLLQVEWQVQDWALRNGPQAPRAQELVYLGIDNPNYSYQYSEEEAAASKPLAAMSRDFPWSRLVWAELIDKLAAAGVRAIVIDILFSSASEQDAVFAAAIHRHAGLVVLGANINLSNVNEAHTFHTMLTPSPSLSGGAGGVG